MFQPNFATAESNNFNLNNQQATIGYININSLRNKFDLLSEIIQNKFSILAVGETKLDDTFPINQFYLHNYKSPYRLDKSKSSGGLLVYIFSDIVSKQLSEYVLPNDFQAIPFEISLKQNKWLVIAVYNPHRNHGKVFLENLSTLLDFYLRKYDNYIIIGDMNLEPSEPIMQDFIDNNCLYNLVKKPTCFKTPRGTCIDLILTNKKHNFVHSDTFETGLSDFHELVYTTFKSGFSKLPPKKISYRSFKNFDEKEFRDEVVHLLENPFRPKVFTNFYSIVVSTLNKHAPCKEKILRGNNKPFMTKGLTKEIWKRSRLKNKANKTNLQSDILQYKKQRNFVTSLVRKEKQSFFNNLELTGNRNKFWEVCKPYFSKKISLGEDRIFIKENGLLVANENKVAELFNSYFNNITTTLNINIWKPANLQVGSDFSTHPSIIKIREYYNNTDNNNLFDFHHVEPKTISETIHNLKKGSGEVPISIVKLLSGAICNNICDGVNSCIDNCYFPDELKWADIIPVFKKGDRSKCENYRPISILPTISKIFERILFDQISSFFQDKFSKFLCGFRKGYSTQTSLIRLLQRWQHCLDQKGVIGTVLIDLSKAYDCIQHNLLIAKLKAYGFSKKSISLLKSYLSNRKQRVKIMTTFSEWLWVNFGIPQGSILGPLLFNIFINDIFLFMEETEICNFADDNTLFACDKSIDIVIMRLKKDLININKWFLDNSLVANASKFQLMFLGVKENEFSLNIGDIQLKAETEVVLLGITIDNKLTFSKHINNICKLANNKLCAILRLRNSLSVSQTKLLINAHVLSYFYYCPLIWMFCRKNDMKNVTKVHKRALRTIHNNFILNYEELLVLDNGFTIHQKHLQCLMIEIFKSIHGDGPLIVKELFTLKQPSHILRNKYTIQLPSARSTTFGTNSLVFKGSIIWNTLPSHIKNSITLSEFKYKIKNWRGENCSCRSCS